MSSKLIVISAPSGAGKTTLCQRLLRDFAELELSISSTTRKPRGGERDGKEYFFLAVDEFKKKIDQGHFAEWAMVHENYYGTSKKVIEDCFSRGKSVLLDIDVQGADSLCRSYPKEYVGFFISPPSLSELEARLRARGTDTEETILKRLNNARDEMQRQHHFQYTILNDDLDRAYSELKRTVKTALAEA